ncbi:MAG: GNAT family N-acetyltransferase [archaeon]|jgi:N-acetylglutamate synthase-like GNAT family acetyltransferase
MIEVRAVTKKEIRGIYHLMNLGVKEGLILKRSKRELLDLVKSSVVIGAFDKELLVGMAILDFYSKRLSELRSIYVLEEYRKNGVGKLLVSEVIKKAKSLRVKELMTITVKDKKGFFEKYGFNEAVHDFKLALFKEL